ncbi:MAG: DinB family protein [Acidobacteria bacterium]|nr:DinB family protein [Acidobacteriota bacterium]
MSLTQGLIGELEQEAATTRRVLERVPDDKLGWKPHSKSMSLGQLALHIANTPGTVSELAAQNDVTPPDFNQPQADSTAQVLAAHDASVAKAKTYLAGLSDEAAMEEWRVVAGGQTVMAMPRIGLLRGIMLNHWYHHRGQMTVYLRQLDVPVPSVYGPSADENPFAR